MYSFSGTVKWTPPLTCGALLLWQGGALLLVGGAAPLLLHRVALLLQLGLALAACHCFAPLMKK